MKISYLVTCKNETLELLQLIEKLKTHIDFVAPNDEVVILDDFSNNEDTKKILAKAKSYGFTVVQHELNKNFSEHKNNVLKFIIRVQLKYREENFLNIDIILRELRTRSQQH